VIADKEEEKVVEEKTKVLKELKDKFDKVGERKKSTLENEELL
jgi:hypothetical protein